MKQIKLRPAMARALIGFAVLMAGSFGAVHAANNTCWTFNPGHIYYVAYSTGGPEYIVDLGDRTVFLSATDTIPPVSMNIYAADFATVFTNPAQPNLKIGLFGVQDPPVRTAIMSANGAKNDAQLGGSSIVGADSQIESWSTGIRATSNGVGVVCRPNAATYPGSLPGSYQFSLNSTPGSISGNLAWNVETRLSDSLGVRTQTNKIPFFCSMNNPGTGAYSRSSCGYFIGFTDGTARFWPDADGDFLPDVPLGSDPNADKCTMVNSPDNTDGDGDNHAAPCDCQENNSAVWGAIPTETLSVQVAPNKTTISWTAPTTFYGSGSAYDVIKSQQISAGGTAPIWLCFLSNQAAATASDATTPSANSMFLYQVRAQTDCGEGNAGQSRINHVLTPRVLPSCP